MFVVINNLVIPYSPELIESFKEAYELVYEIGEETVGYQRSKKPLQLVLTTDPLAQHR